MSKPEHNLVVATKPWNRRIFEEEIRCLPGEWSFVDSPECLTYEAVRGLAPRYIFFLHWSWKVPADIVNEFECVCFHMTDVPYGRGGSPLQNLITEGHHQTMLTALRMVEQFDAGPVYLKNVLSLEGTAEAIYMRASRLAARMIKRILDERMTPKAQSGEGSVFKRRQPHQSEIPECVTLEGLYDFFRMLDAEGYPRAFLRHAGYRYQFSRAALYDGRIVADVIITRDESSR